MSLFRRLRRDKEETPAEGGAPAEPATSPPTPPAETSPKPASPPPTPAPTGPTPAVASPAPPPNPPPLPARSPEASARATDRGPFGTCFVCGATLDGRTCPTCRMTWVE